MWAIIAQRNEPSLYSGALSYTGQNQNFQKNFKIFIAEIFFLWKLMGILSLFVLVLSDFYHSCCTMYLRSREIILFYRGYYSEWKRVSFVNWLRWKVFTQFGLVSERQDYFQEHLCRTFAAHIFGRKASVGRAVVPAERDFEVKIASSS